MTLAIIIFIFSMLSGFFWYQLGRCVSEFKEMKALKKDKAKIAKRILKK